MKNIFENITNDEIETLKWILYNPNATPADRFFDDPTIDGRVEELESNRLITISPEGELNISELGRAALKEYDHQKLSSRKHLIWSVVQFIITTGISLAALIVSIVALIQSSQG